MAIERLRYPELGDLGPLLDMLRQRAWIDRPGVTHFDDVVDFLTRSEIYDVLKPRIAGLSRTLKKAELVEFVRENVSAVEFTSHLRTDFKELVSETANWPKTDFPTSARLRDELAYRLGRMAEKRGEIDDAISLFKLGESAHCSEKLIRLLLSSGRRDEAQRHLQNCIDDPRSVEDKLARIGDDCGMYIAADHYNRRIIVTKHLRMLKMIVADRLGLRC